MKKTKIILIVALALVVVGALGGWIAWSSVSQPTAIADVKTFEQEINSIIIDADNVGIEVRSTADTTAKVELVGNAHKNTVYSFDAQVENGTLFVSSEKSGQSWLNLYPISLSIIISLPENQYDLLRAEGNSGAIQIEGLQADEIDCKTINSGISLIAIASETITVETNAHIGLTDVVGNSITAKTSASIDMVAVEADSITARTDAKITLSTSHIDRHIDLESDSGSILVKTEQAPENVSFDVSSSGSINLFGGRYAGSIGAGDGKNVVRLVATGSITVEEGK